MPLALPESIRTLMEDLASGLRFTLGDRLIGLYLGGSLSLDDFYENSSDLDFLVVTDGPLSPEDLLAIGMLHEELRSRHPYAARLEGDYAPLSVLTPQGPSEPVPGCEGGRFLPRVGEIMISADDMWLMREDGIAFYGPDARDLLPAVEPDQVRSAVRHLLLEGLDCCDTPEDAAAATLCLVRSHYALEVGMPVSKTCGAAWALGHLDARWHRLIETALAVRTRPPTPEEALLLSCELPELERTLRGNLAPTSAANHALAEH